jgi:NAD(P)-dependent dehydrogenase (short-subunit alcohol dehydrogenase family)
MNISFEGKVALVTGAGSGMGLATAKAFAEEKAAVVLADVQEKAILAAAEELVAAPQASIMERFGKVWDLASAHWHPNEAMTVEALDKLIRRLV